MPRKVQHSKPQNRFKRQQTESSESLRFELGLLEYPSLVAGTARGETAEESQAALGPLFSFMLGLARLLESDFAPATSLRSQDSDEIPYQFERKTYLFGDETGGFEVVKYIGCDVGSGLTDTNSLTIRVVGLPDGTALELEHFQFVPPFGSRPPSHYIELRVTAPKDVTERVFAAFESELNRPGAQHQANEPPSSRPLKAPANDKGPALSERKSSSSGGLMQGTADGDESMIGQPAKLSRLGRLWWRPLKMPVNQPIGVVLSILLLMAGIFLLPSLLTGKLGNQVWLVLTILLVVPLLPTLAALLQGKVSASAVNAFTLYVFEAITLYFDIFFLLLILPYLALQVLWVGNGIFLLAMCIGLLVTLFNRPAEIDAHLLSLFTKSLVIALLSTIVLAVLKGREDRLLDYGRSLRAKVFDKVKTF